MPKDHVYDPELNVPPVEGTVGKCVFCADRLRINELPRCVRACPMGVIYFGDVNEDAVTNGVETLRFSSLMVERHGYRHMEELGTMPTVYYLPPLTACILLRLALKTWMNQYQTGTSHRDQKNQQSLRNEPEQKRRTSP